MAPRWLALLARAGQAKWPLPGCASYRPSSSSAAAEATSDRNHLIYTQEHFALRASLRKIIDKEINPFVDKWEEEGQFPAHQVFKILGKAGFLGVNKPIEYGGLGLDFSYSMAVAEELGNIRCGGVPMAIGVQSDMATPALARFGSDELKQQFLAPTIAGDVVACLGVSEPEAGSDVAVSDRNTLTKTKMLVAVDIVKLPGVHVAKKIEKIGMRSSDTAQIFFEDVRVPSKYLIGEEGMGFTYQMLQFQEERLWAAANILAPLENVIQETIDYTRQRKTFNQPILYNQTVHFRLAELTTELELLRSLVYRAVALYIQGNDVTKLASMAKLKAGRLARELTDSCLQFWGGMGFTNEVLVSRLYRDSRLLSIGGGSDEVMLSIICKYMQTLPKKQHL
ncbi:PREDICTED: probable acyl-CoA dehydrogenase 6 [Gekko japonicus]|uniref:Probable acyl-CoA dehydrogenase 6 n=1 Tax=Gekko japonicus TaxID=146911 RepID=A0ABM1KPP5_GEKJA|nr:PREDICTED: probable acyl-CoA dehydrogenase 6 [Gekko japonicus]